MTSPSARRRVFLSLGSNAGRRGANLRAARAALAHLPDTELVVSSPVYETDPQDFLEQPAFLNQVVCLETGLSPRALLGLCRAIEDQLGRVRTVRFGPRTLDVDILLYEGVEADEPELALPHPRMWRRAFVLVPLATIWSYARGMPDVDVASLAEELAGQQAVELHGEVED